jgi:hypothetical protein
MPSLPYPLRIGEGDDPGARVGLVVFWQSFLGGGPVRPVREPEDPNRDDEDDNEDSPDEDEDDDDD